MRLGFIGDVHAEDIFLAKAVNFLKEKGAERIYCAGDVVDGPGCVNTCCRILMSENIPTVRGNHDRWLFEGRDDLTPLSSLQESSIDFLKNLPVTLDISTDLGVVHLCHGYGTNDMARLTPDERGYGLENLFELHDLIRNADLSFVVNGHSHKRMVRRFHNLTVINVGTLYREHDPCFALLDCQQGAVDFYDFVSGDVKPSLSVRLADVAEERILGI